MPIYAYKCDACGHAKDVLQKISHVPLSDCPACGASTFRKQLTSAGFQLKGSGWYVTDFKNGNTAAAAKPGDAAKPADTPPEGQGTDQKVAPAGQADSPAPAAVAAPAASPAVASSDSSPKTV
jgi:putative FmdB family regulatory protein